MKLIYTGIISGGYSAKVHIAFEDYDSSVEFPTDEQPYCMVKIGGASNDWSEIFDGILHEMMEFHMTNMELAYQRWFRVGCDTGDVWFTMSHAEYSECISRASYSILLFMDIAKKEFDKHMKVLHSSPSKPKKIKKDETTNNDSD